MNKRHIETFLSHLEKTPILLQDLLKDIPPNRLKEKREGSAWSIHEWACHLISAQEMIYERFVDFTLSEFPEIKAHLPQTTQSDDDLLRMNLEDALTFFPNERERLLSFCQQQSNDFWKKEGNHEEYNLFNPYILLRHTTLIDYNHLFKIERLWLTKDAYL